MTNAPDWLSDNRAGILAMAQAWCTIFREQVKNEKGEDVAKYAAWGIPFAVFSLFMETYDAARNALQVALNEETRTKITTSACKDAFTELEAQMRSIKKRYSMGRHGIARRTGFSWSLLRKLQDEKSARKRIFRLAAA